MTSPFTATEPDENGRWPTRDELAYKAAKEAGFPGLGVPTQQSRGVVTELQTAFAVEGNDTSPYLGVTQDRMTYANETEQPLRAEEGVERELEDRLLEQPVLVAPVEEVTGNQTAGGGSSHEPVATALSGENFSAEIAEPLTTEKVPAEDAPESQQGLADDSGQVEQGVSGGSTGQTVSEAESETATSAPAASPAPTTSESPTPAKKAAARTPSSSS